MNTLIVNVDGQQIDPSDPAIAPLHRAVLISLFTRRRADQDDELPGSLPHGWWADGIGTPANDRIGSRLWLLVREKITPQLLPRIEGYAHEALQWLVDDGVADSVAVRAERIGVNEVGLTVTTVRDGRRTDMRFGQHWEAMSV